MKTIHAIVIFIVLFAAGATHTTAAEEGISWKIEMIPWEKVNGILPKYSKFTVLDVETGKKFKVQRRAGSHHADVQPLDAEETKIMKSIYGGKWSWKRRAIIIINGNQWIAASMHGMPHGGGALKNNFPGHFCIHFYGSTTHRTNYMDLSHKLMILKAAGKLDGYLYKANPYEVISAFMAGLKQQDSKIVQPISLQPLPWNKILPIIENVRLSAMPVLPAEDLTGELSLEVPVEVDWFIKNRGRMHFRGSIYLVRYSQTDAWKVDNKRFFKENKLVNE
ncbi:hypothetical protein [Cytobacillus oceanisediminis]|jgi:hypothetical protein|uniref:Uncharacterized protein n=1 Tax=Cytobacillus oceanisediminis TaxID=665099 RepID=A0ABX3CTD9_9BACI|nr:hypothetical protein [Cytobacillus oceanisediminis]OHX48351.1 hypothetical protein BBV17_17975 [Cytobacillus oceanisediminis]